MFNEQSCQTYHANSQESHTAMKASTEGHCRLVDEKLVFAKAENVDWASIARGLVAGSVT